MKCVALQRLTICDCGFPVLDKSITVGTKYTIDDTQMRLGFSYFCGGCGKVHNNVAVVPATQILHPEMPMMPLPYDLFLPKT